MSSTTRGNEEDHWDEYLLPKDSGKFSISPLAVIQHARDSDRRELVKELEIDEETGDATMTYSVLSGVDYNNSDPTQSGWKMEYGLECKENGLSRAFLNIDEEGIDHPEAYAETVAEDIFSAFEKRTEKYYGRS